MYILALTGSIATGKTTILQLFAKNNIKTLSSDEIVHQLYQNEAVEKIAKIFPKAIKNNKVDREILSQIITQQPENLIKLEQIIHPLVRKKQQEFIEKSKKEGEKLIVIEIPLLFESNENHNFSGVLVVYCPKELLVERALKRKNMTKEKLEIILQNQMEQEEKIKRADFTIDSSQPISVCEQEVKKIIKILI